MNKVIVDKARLLRRAIVISWISLALCFVIKIFGGNFFEIMCNNPNYKALCEFIDRYIWFDCITATLSSFICQSLYLLSIIQEYKFKKWQFIVNLITVILSTLTKIFIPEIGFIGDILLLFIVPVVFLGKNYKKYWHIIVAFILTLSFQLISLFTKSIAIKVIDEDTFISLIYMIDIYFMCFLYYLYRNFEKEKQNMGKYWVLFAGKPVDRLKKMKAKREEKISKLEKEIADIELIIEQKKNEK